MTRELSSGPFELHEWREQLDEASGRSRIVANHLSHSTHRVVAALTPLT